MGVTVSETTAEDRIASVTTMPNSFRTRPTIPPINRIGRKTATSDSDMEMIVPVTSWLPTIAA
ncbi:Uncharacterised protein [Brucella neotomae]|nr:Uncharacterised protein [Brucella neotomae]SPU71013.1 Uncharacterised protein [Brucella neotomae]